MEMLIVNPAQAQTLKALNDGGDPRHRIEPVKLADERFALNADLLTDTGPGQTWARYDTALRGLAKETATAALTDVAAAVLE